ncbi:MAG TPA: tRNA pseudouridine(55) synthase TruB, partial [Mycobacteriales bacterium]|nr:tRNA pseudouridine(55) synthase TruB [Mycobacteriales bacterium]
AKLRGILKTKKVGHSGTLDPDATGVLLVGVGRVTRLLRFLTALPKIYIGEVVLGTSTSTLDASGDVTATHDMTVTLDDVRRAATSLTGAILQVPPMVSAKQVGGQRLHELARQGIEVEREPVAVTVHRFDVEPTDDPLVYRIEVECSTGTYIRSLAADLGIALGGGAHLRNLRRTAIGSFAVDDAHRIDDITDAMILPPAVALRDYPRVAASAELLGSGKVLARGHLKVEGDGPWAVVDETGELLAVYEGYHDDMVKPAVLIPR